jgi:hypothetical protein
VRIRGTFLDEISFDIPHQNWGVREWDRDFAAMKAIGINTVILIRCGLERWISYPSKILQKEVGAYEPPLDLVDMYLTLAEKYDMRFFFGTYIQHSDWCGDFADHQKVVDLDKRVVDEAWERYGHRRAFQGWYLSKEVPNKVQHVVDEFVDLGRHCKDISGNLPVLISPCMLGRKAYLPGDSKAHALDFDEHMRHWDDIMGTIAGCVDIVAFQDGHVEFDELPEVLIINKTLAEKHGMECWTNSETFDRDMPIRFLPIKWEKLLLKLKAAEKVGITNAITFEFSHFMSPYSAYPQARGLYNRYCEHFGIQAPRRPTPTTVNPY